MSWASPRRDPGGSAFASDLVLASSADRGTRHAEPLRLNEDRPGSRGFESLAIDAHGAVIAAWIEPGERSRTRAARVVDGAVAERADLGSQTCPCCRIAVAAHATGVGVLWRDEFPGQVRDMVFAASGAPFAFPARERVRDDGWAFAACPHRGGPLAFAPGGRAVAAWYTEGRDGEPALWIAQRGDGGFGAPLARAQQDRGARRAGRRAARTVRVVSSGAHASGPAIASSTPGGEFVAAWNEEAFPSLRTVVADLSLRAER